MYQALTFYHSLTRWAVLAALTYAVFRSGMGYIQKRPFSKTDYAIRHWTATVAHIQLVIGVLLYFQSPIIQYFRFHFSEARQVKEMAFFGLLHPLLMLTAIILLTVGAALSKRKVTDAAQFKTQWIWFSIALLVILIAVPWPFSPLATRPYFR